MRNLLPPFAVTLKDAASMLGLPETTPHALPTKGGSARSRSDDESSSSTRTSRPAPKEPRAARHDDDAKTAQRTKRSRRHATSSITADGTSAKTTAPVGSVTLPLARTYPTTRKRQPAEHSWDADASLSAVNVVATSLG